jgi:hypothetical protein
MTNHSSAPCKHIQADENLQRFDSDCGYSYFLPGELPEPSFKQCIFCSLNIEIILCETNHPVAIQPALDAETQH